MASDGRARLLKVIDSALRRQVAVGALSRYQHARDCAELTLNTCEGVFLHLLELHGPLAPGRLGQLAGVSSGTVTGVLDRLERAGQVRRDRAARDRRAVIVSLCVEPYPIHGAAERTRTADVVARYSDDQLELIADFLTRLTENASGLRPCPGDGKEQR
ncbi:MarR family transcriptional regulator [Pseudonocardia acaciae]|uniref:MarR family transcriptional regulator n=1 Tax=Pseudonocardia acaciae TaxID=551276 RepID=UPI0006852C3B|nr:MarR family transcriptional regulator [Pseudonocardia acaciae]